MSNPSQTSKKLGTLCYLENDGHYLMLHRGKSPNLNQWTPPGGKVEFAESPQECIIREMAEETGFQIDHPRLFGLVTEVAVNDDYNWLLFIYHCHNFTGRLIDCAEGELAWIPKSQMLQLDMPEADYHFVRHLLAGNNGLFQAKFFYDEQIKMTHYHQY